MRTFIAALLLMLPAVAHAKTGATLSAEAWGAIATVIVTAISGGGGLMWWRQHRDGVEGRENLSTRAQVAIARDNDEAVLREKIDGYRAEVKALKEAAAAAESKVQAVAEITASLAAEVKALSRRIDRQQDREDVARLQASIDGLTHKLGFAIDDIARRAGDHRVR